MNLFYDFNGRRHEITRAEIDEIERSGKPHRVQDYAFGAPTEWNDESWAQLSHLHDRPGAVEHGTRPPRHRDLGGGRIKRLDQMERGKVHWMVRRTDGRDGSMTACAGAVGFTNRKDNRFRHHAQSARACSRCVDLFNAHNR